VADAREPPDEHADGCIRARRPACGGGDDDEGPLPVTRVTVFHARDCSLCERALEVVQEVHSELDFELELVDIAADPSLEAHYRELLPVVEVDGVQAFTYYVQPDALRKRLTS
jgi:glutaredoxin